MQFYTHPIISVIVPKMVKRWLNVLRDSQPTVPQPSENKRQANYMRLNLLLPDVKPQQTWLFQGQEKGVVSRAKASER
jgi:hypothetical protein